MKNRSNNPHVFTLSEAAKELGISRQAVHEAIKKGLLEAHKAKITKTIVQVTRGWVIQPDAIRKYQVSESHISRGKKT